MASGRDRDPGYRKKTTKPVAKRPVAAKKPSAKPIKEEVQPAITPPADGTLKAEPVVVSESTKADQPKVTATEVTVKKEKIVETKSDKTDDTTTHPPVAPPTKEKNPHRTSKKSKLLGVIVALLFLLGLIALGYSVISSIMEKESIEKLDDSFVDDGVKSTGPNSTDAILDNEEETEVTSGENPQDGAIGKDVGADVESSSETDLSNENSIESEMNEAKEEFSDKSSDEQEKEAIKTKIIRKKGEFELPSWIIAFSANSKKPLANTNYSTLEALGYDAGIYWIPKYFPGGSEMYKVYVGPYKSSEEAASMLPAIKNLQPDAYIMKIEE